MPDTSSILSCSYGGSSFTVIDYTVRETPHIDKATASRIGTYVRVEVDGEVRSSSVTDFSTQLLNLEEAFRSDGLDLLIFGLNGTQEYYVPASGSIDGGPHCGFQMSRGDSILSKKIKLIVTTEQSSASNSNTPANSYQVKTAQGPDELQVVTWAGQLNGVNLTAYFLSTVFPNFQSVYGPDAMGNSYWSVDFTLDASQTGTATTAKYTMTAREYHGALPGTGANVAVSGTASQRVECDEHYRKTTVSEFDALLPDSADPIAFLAAIRPTTGVILRESYKLETLKSNSLSGSFSQLASNDPKNSPLMNFQQTARLQIPPTLWEEKRYVGAAPIMVQLPQRMPRVMQSGSAVAAGAFYQGPSPIYPVLVSPQEVTLNDQNDLEKQTSWSYEMIATTFMPGDGNGNSGGSALADLTQFNASQIGRGNVDVKPGGSGSGWFPGVTPPPSGTSADGD